MGLPKADFLIQRILKKDSNLHDILVLLSHEINKTQQVLADAVFGTNQGGVVRGTFKDIAETVQKVGITIKSNSAAAASGGGSRGGGSGGNMFKRISVRV